MTPTTREIHPVLLQEIDLGQLMDGSNMLWVSAILASLPIVLMVAIAAAVVHGNRVRKKQDDTEHNAD